MAIIKGLKPIILLSIIVKIPMEGLQNMKINDPLCKSLSLFFILVHALLFIYILLDNKENLKIQIWFSFIIDMIYSISMTILVANKIINYYILAIPSLSLYYIASHGLFKTKALEKIVVFYGIILLILSLWSERNNLNNYSESYYYVYFIFNIMVMISSTVYKEKHYDD
jgi:hypothetical protein